MNRKKIYQIFVFSLLIFHKAFAQDITQIISNVDTIWCGGSPGPVISFSNNSYPLVSGSQANSLVCLAGYLDSGKVIAIGHEGFFSNDKIISFDNAAFTINAFKWLDKNNYKKILIATSHGEWLGNEGSEELTKKLTSAGFNVRLYNSAFTADSLKNISAVFIGNAWDEFSQNELDALEYYVRQGGGVFLCGLGWSYLTYNAPKTLDDYPMNKIGKIFGMKWLDGSISDTKNYQNSPLFLNFYPNVTAMTLRGAMDYISNLSNQNKKFLAAILQNDDKKLTDFVTAAYMLKDVVEANLLTLQQKQEIFAFYESLFKGNLTLFQKGKVCNTTTENAFIWVRERLYRNFIDVLPLTADIKSRIASSLNLTGRYLDIWNDFSLILLDNSSATEKQKDFIYRYLTSVPGKIHNLSHISLKDNLGKNIKNIDFAGIRGGVNVFNYEVGSATENGFPSEVAVSFIDVFSLVVAHEHNHVVDAFYIQTNNSLKSRHNNLVQSAGTNRMNYLRSVIDDGFFKSNPQEFFASVSNLWFQDSWKTFELGLKRYSNGITNPINQALFFADIYSLDSDTTLFYKVDTYGNITRKGVKLRRNSNGYINELQIDTKLNVKFSIDKNGNVDGITYIEDKKIKSNPVQYSLSPCYPNPFNPATNLEFSLPKREKVIIKVYDLNGKEIESLLENEMDSGIYNIQWNAMKKASGIYYLKLFAGQYSQIRKAVLMK